MFLIFFLADGLEESHHMTVRQAGGRNNRVTDTFVTPSQQELERTGSPVSSHSSFTHSLLFDSPFAIIFNDCQLSCPFLVIAAIQRQQTHLRGKQVQARFL